MTKTYLFDWGDTLMVDFPDSAGKMCDWTFVEAVSGAKEALSFLSKYNDIYIATNAADSTENDIKLAFERVGLSEYISGYFCKATLDISKPSPKFYEAIAGKLKRQPSQIVMVGDSIEMDITPALQAGLNAIWFNPGRKSHQITESIRNINDLRELCI